MNATNNEQSDQRCAALSEVRMVIDGLNDLCAKVREQWPERYPMPADLDALLVFQEYALARVRSGDLRKICDGCKHDRITCHGHDMLIKRIHALESDNTILRQALKTTGEGAAELMVAVRENQEHA